MPWKSARADRPCVRRRRPAPLASPRRPAVADQVPGVCDRLAVHREERLCGLVHYQVPGSGRARPTSGHPVGITNPPLPAWTHPGIRRVGGQRRVERRGETRDVPFLHGRHDPHAVSPFRRLPPKPRQMPLPLVGGEPTRWRRVLQPQGPCVCQRNPDLRTVRSHARDFVAELATSTRTGQDGVLAESEHAGGNRSRLSFLECE